LGSWQYKQSGPDYSFEVSSLSALQPIRDHFIAYPPHKIHSFSAMVKVMDWLLAKEHLTLKGFITILSIKAVFPKGLNQSIQLILMSFQSLNLILFNLQPR
jgi:hypothetical protein